MDAPPTKALRRLLRAEVARLLFGAVVSAALLGALLRPCEAFADGDPASDVLLAQDAYYPYRPTVSRGLEASLSGLLRSAERSRLPLKVAVIGTVGDLGADPTFFGHPQAYAEFLDREISFNDHPPLLVVMPAGFGVAGAGPSQALAGIEVDSGHGSDGLVRSALRAAVALIRQSGHTVAAPAVSSSGSGASGSPTALFAVPVGLLVVFGLFGFARNRRRRDSRAAGAGGASGER